MSSDDEDRYPTIQHTRQRDLVEDDDDDVDIDDDEQYEDDMGDNNGDVMDGDEDGDDDEGDQRITAWGTQKKRFYREGDEDESDQAEEDEEEEAKLIEKLQQEQLSHENFFDVFGDQALAGKQKKGGEFEEEDEEFPSFTLKAKFRSMEDLAESDKIALIQKESPELLNIIKQFKATLKEIKYKFLPLISYLREKKTTMKEGQRYIEIKFNLLTSYCINLSFYILLNSQGKSVKDHPVIKRLISLKTSLDRLKPLDKKLQGEINQILKSIEQDKALKPKKGKQAGKNLVQNAKKSDKNLFEDANKGKKAAKNTENGKGKAALKSALKGEVPSGKAPKELLGKRGLADLKKKSVKFAGDEDIDDEIDDDDMEGLGDDIDDFGGEGFGDEDDGEDDFYKKIKNMKKVKRDTIGKEKAEKKKEQFVENPKHFVGEEDSRRVTRKIEKNKGLTRHRGKTSGNARIKHKNRYQKAQHKLISKNIVVREKGDYYTGEKHISAGKIRSTKY